MKTIRMRWARANLDSIQAEVKAINSAIRLTMFDNLRGHGEISVTELSIGEILPIASILSNWLYISGFDIGDYIEARQLSSRVFGLYINLKGSISEDEAE